MTLALVCGVCRKSLSEMVTGDQANLAHTPCGHVFHHGCISKFFETNVDGSGKSFCHNCKVRCNGSSLVKLYPIYREESPAVLAAPEVPKRRSEVTWMNYIVAYALFIFVIIFGNGSMEQQKLIFANGDDELHELGTYMGSCWAVLFGIAGIAAMMYDNFSQE